MGKSIAQKLRDVYRGSRGEDEADESEEKSRGDLIEMMGQLTGITESEVRELAQFCQSSTWRPFVLLLRYLKTGSDSALRSYKTTDPLLRHHQGRIAALEELTDYLIRDLPSCYKGRAAKKGAP